MLNKYIFGDWDEGYNYTGVDIFVLDIIA